jgi:hypothetical protein
MRKTSLKDTLPSIPGGNGLSKNIDIFSPLNTLVRRRWPFGKF